MSRVEDRSPVSSDETLPRFERIRHVDGEWYLACGEVITFLFEYLDEGVPAQRRLEFDRHLAICPSCQNYVDSYRETLRLVQRSAALDEAEIPEVPQELVDAILEAERR